MRCILVVALGILACGDNFEPTCEVPEAALPASGAYIDPLALPLPQDCAVAGLRNLPGRWFLRDPQRAFQFDYPRYDGSCRTGFTRAFDEPDDHDLEDDGYTRHTWSDGTRWYQRRERRYELNNGGTLVFMSGTALCWRPDDTLAVVYVYYTEFDGMVYNDDVTHGIGTRFRRKGELARGLELVSEVGQTPSELPIAALNLVIDNGYAYVVGHLGLDIIDVRDPAAPVHVSHLDGAYNDVKVVRTADLTVAYLSPLPEEMTYIADVTDPAAPSLVSVIPEYSHSVFLQERDGTAELYLATYENYVPRYVLTNPLAPTRVGATALPGDPSSGVHDLHVAGDIIYANNTTAGLVAVDVSAGLNAPVTLGTFTSSYSHASWIGTPGGRSVVLHGDEGMTRTADGGAFLHVLDGDLASPTFLTEIGRYQTRPEVGIHNFELHGNRAYIAYYQDGVRVVDLSDPTQPREVAYYNTWDPTTAYGSAFEGALGIRAVGGLIYVADSLRGLMILRETP
jgi:hypothetical protein